jgi:uncharacterized protein YhaN
MKIENLHVDGFGIWHDRSWGPLSRGLNVFSGPNETGKSTLMAFIRSMFFGLDRRGHARRYEPLDGGTHGGWLDIHVDGRPVRIQRKAGRHVRGAVTVYDGDMTGSDAELEKLLEGVTKTLYHNVFAFGLEELEHFHTLQDTEISQHVSGAALGIGAARWSAVLKDLEGRQASLFMPRGQSGSINVALKELEAVRDDLDRTEHQPEEYWAAQETRTRLAAEVAGLEDVVTELKQKAGHYEKRLRARPAMEKRRTLEAKLQALPIVESFPEGGVERLELLRKHLQSAQNSASSRRREIEWRRSSRRDLQQLSDPDERNRRVQALESLRNLGPRMDAARRIYESSLERRRAIAQERAAIESAMENIRPPSPPAFYLFILILALTAVGAIGAGYPYVASAILGVTLLPLFWYRRRLAAFAGLQKQFGGCSERMDACTAETRKVEEEARQIQTDLFSLTGRTEIVQADIDSRVKELDRMTKFAEDLRRLDDLLERMDHEATQYTANAATVQDAIDAFFVEAGASDEADFLQRAEIFKERQRLIAELDRLPVEPPEPVMLFDIRSNDEEAHAEVLKELAAMEQRLVEARHEAGRVAERIALMERSEERSRALARQEVVLAKVDTAAEMWAVVTLCKTLLDETRKVYEGERQPDVLRHASTFFGLMTEGRYTRVIAPLGGGDIQVERQDGVRLEPQFLSRGAAEQLYLAMRFALLRDYAQHHDPLPVVFDDVFVNFDPVRTRNTLLAVRELTATHQVLLFTCHPHVAEMAQEVIPESTAIAL